MKISNQYDALNKEIIKAKKDGDEIREQGLQYHLDEVNRAMQVNDEAKAEHPIANFTGALAGQTQAILMTAGLGGVFGLGKAAANAEFAGDLLGGETAGKIAKAVTGNAGVGALYGLIKGGVDQWNASVNNNDHPHVIKVGEEALKDAGVFGLYGAVGAVGAA